MGVETVSGYVAPKIGKNRSELSESDNVHYATTIDFTDVSLNIVRIIRKTHNVVDVSVTPWDVLVWG